MFPGSAILRYIRSGAKKGDEEEGEGRKGMRERERFGIMSTARSDRESRKRVIREKDKVICIGESAAVSVNVDKIVFISSFNSTLFFSSRNIVIFNSGILIVCGK